MREFMVNRGFLGRIKGENGREGWPGRRPMRSAIGADQGSANSPSDAQKPEQSKGTARAINALEDDKG